ncbi:ferrous iron transporter FeoB [Rhodobacter sp. JA431]|uniref:nucleoside recognition domain-containing protein n=1 Tax=Rhodobacter sp. JA431 TaxID=570013 RepID=UPI000BC4C74F
MDRAMRAIGLPGKAFVPLIVGFGCNVPAVMATRTIERPRDRILTIVMAPFMSCGARLPVYALFAAVFFPAQGGLIVFSLYLAGIAVAILSGLALKATLLSGPVTPFVMELPPYHLPTLRGVALRTWEKTRSFVLQATKIIVPMVMVLNVLNSLGTDGSFGHADSRNSVLSQIGRTITPIFAPMGMTEENWPAAVGVFTGVLAKEAVVGTLDALYTEAGRADAALAGEEEAGEDAPFALGPALAEAVATVPANLGDALANWADPLGLGEIEAQAGADATPTGQAMLARFDGAAGAYAYLMFILLYFPCTAVLAAIWREVGAGWALFVAGWATTLGWGIATGIYQAARFGLHPASSAGWLAGLGLGAVALMLGLRLWAGRAHPSRPAQV